MIIFLYFILSFDIQFNQKDKNETKINFGQFESTFIKFSLGIFQNFWIFQSEKNVYEGLENNRIKNELKKKFL